MDKQIFLKGHCVMTIFATSCIFSDIFPVNSMLMNLAANVFYSSGVSSLTSQDALSLLDQVGISEFCIFSCFSFYDVCLQSTGGCILESSRISDYP
ncbi:hypothetical protein ACS0TY_000506 [Phlomoides rotata]